MCSKQIQQIQKIIGINLLFFGRGGWFLVGTRDKEKACSLTCNALIESFNSSLVTACSGVQWFEYICKKHLKRFAGHIKEAHAGFHPPFIHKLLLAKSRVFT